MGAFSRYCDEFQGICIARFFVQSWKNFGQKFQGQSVHHLFLGQSYTVRISGTKIEKLFQTVLKASLLSKKTEISLCSNFCR
jgi:hypothetical protein